MVRASVHESAGKDLAAELREQKDSASTAGHCHSDRTTTDQLLDSFAQAAAFLRLAAIVPDRCRHCLAYPNGASASRLRGVPYKCFRLDLLDTDDYSATSLVSRSSDRSQAGQAENVDWGHMPPE